MISKIATLSTDARPPASGAARARSLATACVRRARATMALSQDALGAKLGTVGRCIRRAESGSSDLGHLEVALRCPVYARALALELLEIANREAHLPLQNSGSRVAPTAQCMAPSDARRLEFVVSVSESAAPSVEERLAA